MNDSPIIIATGPLTDKVLASEISSVCKMPNFSFLDSNSPVVDGTSINYNNPQINKINDDLLVIRIDEGIFQTFFDYLQTFYTVLNSSKDCFCTPKQCKSLEKVAQQGLEELVSERFSPDGYGSISLLLRRESCLRDAYVLVGCTTGLRHKEQKNLFSLLPSLENIKFIRYGSQHRNTFFRTPGKINSFFKVKQTTPEIYLIGQLAGLDGYAPAIASGYIAAQNIINPNKREAPRSTMIGALSHYVSNERILEYQPMCASFSLMPSLELETVRDHSLIALSKWQKD